MHSFRSRHRDGLIAATVRVVTRDDRGGESATGTGFLVAPGRVVTCAHVVPGGRHVVVYQGIEHPADVLVREPDDPRALYSYPDVALLVVAIEDHPCVPLGTTLPDAGRELYAYGCPLLADGLPFWDHMSLRSEGERVQYGTEHRFLKTTGGQVQPGASGSGAVDLRTGDLVGMLKLTRDPGLDLGGVLVPTSVIVSTLAAAGHDVVAANRLATAESDTLAAARRRLYWVLQVLVNELATVLPAHRRSMLMGLPGRPGELGDTVDENEAALALLDLDLDDLGDVLAGLARACHSAEVPRRLLGGAAAFAWLADRRPWVEPQAAALLAAERRSVRPRVVHLPVVRDRSKRLHVARAAVDRHWELVPLTPLDGDTDHETGLPVGLVRAVRCELLKLVGPVDEADPEDIARRWAARRDRALAKACDLLLLLPEGMADTATLDALRRAFPSCLFAVAGRAVPPALRGDADRVLVLPESLDETDEAVADERYEEIIGLIGRAAV